MTQQNPPSPLTSPSESLVRRVKSPVVSPIRERIGLMMEEDLRLVELGKWRGHSVMVVNGGRRRRDGFEDDVVQGG